MLLTRLAATAVTMATLALLGACGFDRDATAPVAGSGSDCGQDRASGLTFNPAGTVEQQDSKDPEVLEVTDAIIGKPMLLKVQWRAEQALDQGKLLLAVDSPEGWKASGSSRGIFAWNNAGDKAAKQIGAELDPYGALVPADASGEVKVVYIHPKAAPYPVGEWQAWLIQERGGCQVLGVERVALTGP